jgi:hypothetical protein
MPLSQVRKHTLPLSCHPSAAAASLSASKMWAQKVSERCERIDVVPNLEYGHGSPGTIYKQKLWIERFENYRLSKKTVTKALL